MTTDSPQTPTDVELLRDYLNQRIDHEGRDIPLADALSGFQEYHRQLQDLRTKVRRAEESLARGEGSPLDIDAAIGRLRRRLAEQGINH